MSQPQVGFFILWRIVINKPPAFQFYPKDFLMDDKVIVMNLEETGAYIKLLCLCWNNNGLTKDQKELKNMCGNPNNWESIWVRVSKCFYEKKGKLYNKRLEKELKKQKMWREKSRLGGIQSGISRGKMVKPNMKGGSTKPKPPLNSSVFSLQSSSASSIIREEEALAPTERKILNELKKVKNYPYNLIDTLEYIRELAVDFPDIDILDEIQKKIAWWRDNPLTKKSNPHLQLRNWLKNAVKFNNERRRDDEVGGQSANEKTMALYEKQKADGVFDNLDKEDY